VQECALVGEMALDVDFNFFLLCGVHAGSGKQKFPGVDLDTMERIGMVFIYLIEILIQRYARMTGDHQRNAE
jgi:hypothetical protein